jgi:hypothetical protein
MFPLVLLLCYLKFLAGLWVCCLLLGWIVPGPWLGAHLRGLTLSVHSLGLVQDGDSAEVVSLCAR